MADKNIPAFLVAVLSLAVCFSGYSDENQPKNNTSDNNNRYGNIEDNKPPIIDSIACSVGGYSSGCFKNENHQKSPAKDSEKATDFVGIESYRTAKEDLLAQQSMDRSATKMVSISEDTYWLMVISLILSSVGVIVIWKTLAATQKANANTLKAIAEASKANDIMEENIKIEREARILELRPYISIDDITASIIPPDHSIFDRASKIKFTFTLTNHGQTPVRDAQIQAHSGFVSIHLSSGGDTVELSPYIKVGQIAAMIQINPRSTVRSSLTFDAPANIALTESRKEVEFTIEASVRFKDLGTDTLKNMHRRIKFEATGSDRLITSGDSVTVKYWREALAIDGNNNWISR